MIESFIIILDYSKFCFRSLYCYREIDTGMFVYDLFLLLWIYFHWKFVTFSYEYVFTFGQNYM